ncbi:glycosyltransferase [bacterium]|nr:glycosyltransferase [bacterium]
MSFTINNCSLVFPLYNEQSRVKQLVEKLILEIDAASKNFEVIFVLDGCKDKTLEYLKNALKDNATFVYSVAALKKNLGKGGAIRHGFALAQYENLAFLDADLSIGIKDLSEALMQFQQNPSASLLMAQRQNVLKNKGHQNPQRRWASFGFRWLVCKMFFKKIIDTQAPLKIIKQSAYKKIECLLSENGYLFDIDLYLAANIEGYTTVEYPIAIWLNKDDSKIRLLRDSLKMFKSLVALKYKYMKINSASRVE